MFLWCKNIGNHLSLPETTPQKLWVLKAHTKSDKIDDFGQNIRQDFDIYRNIDHQKAKKLKKKQKKKEQDTQTNKRSNK